MNTVNPFESSSRSSLPRRAWVSPAMCVFFIITLAILRLGVFGHRIMPIAFGVPLVFFGWAGSRRWLWITAIGFAGITLVKFVVVAPVYAEGGGAALSLGRRWMDAGLVIADLTIIAVMVNVLIGAREGLEERNRALRATNEALAARDEEITRQNEALQSQAAELERQTEELRVGNVELERREHVLRELLSLSRALATGQPREQISKRICQAVGQLINVPGTGAAVLEHAAGNFTVRGHVGFGESGPRVVVLPAARAFAGMVLSKGSTESLRDLSLHPDLEIPQPCDGASFVSVLACPLRVGGWPVGTLEVYSRAATEWTTQQIDHVESLAAQASVSLEAAQLVENVQREQQRLEAVLRTLPVGVAVANADCSDIRLNPAGSAIFKAPQGANFADLNLRGRWGGRSREQLFTHDQGPLDRVVLGGQEFHGLELDLENAPGQRLRLLLNAAPIRNPDGRIIGGVAAFADIAPQKQLQQELELRRSEAEEANTRKTRFLAAVSHDIRTPANAISLIAELISRSAESPEMAHEVPELSRELRASAKALVNLLGDVLDLARFDSGRIELVETEFSLAACLEEEVRQMLPLARAKGISLEVIPCADAIVLRADRIKMSRILGNLIGNAIKFTSQGAIHLKACRSSDGGVEIDLVDTGIGIAPEHQRHIFDEFVQVGNPERDRNKGIGLGLTICKRLVNAMDGRLEVHSEVGQGSRFSVYFPATRFVSVTL